MSNYIEVKNGQSIVVNDSYQNVSFDSTAIIRASSSIDWSHGITVKDISDGDYAVS